MTVQRYESYRESGVEWLGEVPSHWEVHRLKASVRDCRNGIWGEEPEGSDEDIICVRVADFDRIKLAVRLDNPTFRKVTEKERGGRIIKRGDLLIEKSGGGEKQPVGVVVIYDHPDVAVCSNFVARIDVAERCSPRFFLYVHASAYSLGLTLGAINQTSGIQNLDQSRYFETYGPYPPAAEQIAIAAFLDRETAKIDALVKAQRRLIELLKEKRQAVISHAVTKGLDPTAPMKDSGIEWLGEVPAHWEIERLANLFMEVAEPGDDTLPILSVSIHRGVSDAEIPEDELERKVSRSEDRSKYKAVRPDDLVYNMMRAWQGGFGSVTVHGAVSPAYVVARPRKPLATEFVEWALRTPMCVEEMRRLSVGVTDFRLRLYWDSFKNLRVALPSINEQRSILSKIGSEIARYASLTEAAERAITLLQERRAALISAAVTGKIDVRNAVREVEAA